MASWTFLTFHARVLMFVAHDPGVRLRDIAASLNITERSAFGIITDLVQAGYVVKEKNGRRNRYHVQAHLPAAATATTSRRTSRCQNRTGGNAPSGRSWPS
jgi:DNA-binding IclR family transcriptional regulator